MDTPGLLVCVPTYNEAENIAPFLHGVFENIPPSAHVLVIDDNSPDGTADIAEKIQEEYPGRLHLVRRPGKQGLGAAYLAAFEWGLSRGYGFFLEIDADFSHNPKYIPGMLLEIQSHDVVIGSRNVQGGGVEGWSFARNLISKGGSFYSRAVLGCPIKDLTGGFNLWTKNALEKICLEEIISKGYSFQVEMKYRAWAAHCSIKEMPILFTDRKLGASKMSKKIFLEALINVWKIKSIKGRNSAAVQFIKFVVTGGLGTVTNLALFFLGADKAGLPEIPVSVLCFFIAGSQNYIINHKWSFRYAAKPEPLSVKKWLAFLCASLLGLAVNVAVMAFVVSRWTLPYKITAQALGIAAGMAVNFSFSKLFVWRRAP